jgi:peptide chain release factor 2
LQISALEEEISSLNFWDRDDTSEVISKLNELKKNYTQVKELRDRIKSNLEMSLMLKDNTDKELEMALLEDSKIIEKDLEGVSLILLLNGPYDSCDCILEIHPGAGGTESCDWANMLYRMYTRYCDKKNYKCEIIDNQAGEEAGIKSVSMIVHGFNSYGYLKAEKGVHRLIRISPFDSNSRRHTSFASIDVTPLYQKKDIEIEIKDSDIRVDVYRSSGKGGQGVNTTDSAVRITHLETGIVVTCQNERSQIRNKEIALDVLKNKLYQRQLEARQKELSQVKGDNADINFGSQIRTYTMHPYSLVKDHRTNTETGNVEKVLDGDIDMFINEYLKKVI